MTTLFQGQPRWLGWAWLLPALIGAGLTFMVMLVLPPDRTIDNFGEFLFKLIPLLAGVMTIALFPQRRSWLHWLLLGGFLFYMGFVDSRYVLEVLRLAEAGPAEQQLQFASFYRYTLFVNAFTLFLSLFAFRLGGGGTERTLKLGLAAILILISGLNDLTFWLMYEWPQGRPETFDWASHVIVFTGTAPPLSGMLIFISVHIALVAAVMLAPLGRWSQQLLERRNVPASGGASGAAHD
ncbi:MAG: hypothetical protein H0T53_12125 [Herpetosiphonaceae bacterium]|nr:hypothetical protein [Herpetosiphonaceae bacterium]